MASYFVRKTGSDANAGTSKGAAKLTIQAAINVATTPGDSIYVGAGVYRETGTFGTSGTAGNVISLIGDYKGTFTDDAGVVRITGSNDDNSGTRANVLAFGAKNYITVRGFVLDMSTSHVATGTGTDITIQSCYFGAHTGIYTVKPSGAGQARWIFDGCVFFSSGSGCCIWFEYGSNVDNAEHVVKNCIFSGAGTGVRSDGLGGVSVVNNMFVGSNSGVWYVVSATIPAVPMNVNNNIFFNITTGWAILAATLGQIVENYNTFFATPNTRSNVTAGANSVTRPALLDTRWFFEAVNGGRMVTPFDLASYSTLVEYNSGTGAPSTDIRGASVVGTYREWGSNEFDSNLRISGPVSIASIGGIG